MRSLPTTLVVAALLVTACTDDDEQRAAGTTTTAAACVATEPDQVVATSGDLTFAITDSGASVDVLSVYVEADCGLAPVLLDGAPAALPVGGSVTHGEGVRCEEGGSVAVLSATSDDGVEYEATRVTYEVDGVAFVETDRAETVIDVSEDAAALDPYYRLDC